MNKELLLPHLISDGMVLQREKRIKIWGEAKPESDINVMFCDQKYTSVADKNGKWEIILSDLKPGGPYEMVITCGEQRKVIRDILVGDVWVLGGQSNMELPIERTLDLFEEEVKNANCPEIRQFSVPMTYNFHGPQEELSGGSWTSVTPETIYDFSAVGYFFAKKIYDTYHIPIGLIHAAVGGTPAEAWISEENLKPFERFKEMLTLCKDDAYVNGIIKNEERENALWYEELNAKEPGFHDAKGYWYSETYDDTDWKEMILPRRFNDTEIGNFKGSVWFRKEFVIPEELKEEEAKLVLGTIVDGDETYLNGVLIGSTGYLYPPRRYNIPANLLKPGKNVLAVRVIITQNIGAFVTDMPYFIQLSNKKIPVDGVWKYRIGAGMRAQKPLTFFQYKPTGVYNSMIYPIRKYAIQGVLWYQGESNTGHPEDYGELFKTVIKEWRSTFDSGEFPFLYVQLANYCPWRMEPEESGCAGVREQQRRTLAVHNTGMAVIHDVGEYNDLHPQDKKTVGERLALWAMNMVYGEEIVCSGPIYERMEVEGNQIRLYFKYIGSGLVAKGEELKGFLICGKDGKYHEAEAFIDGDTVVVHSELVKEPVNVRFGWADNPEEANLYNKEGLPASPFTTEE